MADFSKAYALLQQFKGDTYLHGMGVLPKAGKATADVGKRAVLMLDLFPGANLFVENIKISMAAANVELLGEIIGARPNAPREDLDRITREITNFDPDVIVSFGGGSTTDAAKAAEVLHTLGGEIDDYFGTGLVTQALKDAGKDLTPHVAIQTASSSSAHLTKYSNITNLKTVQKKLIVDDAIVPVRPVFDYEVTIGAPTPLTVDGALDGVAHSLEVLYGAIGKPYYPKVEEVALESIELIVKYLPMVLQNPTDTTGREGLGLATDLGGYAIMLGGTNGGHLTSFSLIDILSHGRACAIMNPYYTVFFAPVIQEPLKLIGKIFEKYGYSEVKILGLDGRRLGEAVAIAMIDFQKRVGLPTTLDEVPGFSDAHIERAINAAKNPQLKMKLENMPVPLRIDLVDEYMGSVLQAAKIGDLSIISNVQ